MLLYQIQDKDFDLKYEKVLSKIDKIIFEDVINDKMFICKFNKVSCSAKILLIALYEEMSCEGLKNFIVTFLLEAKKYELKYNLVFGGFLFIFVTTNLALKFINFPLTLK